MSTDATMTNGFPEERSGIPTGKLGMWLFLSSEVMFFAGLIGSYLVLRMGMGSAAWPNPSSILNIPLLAVNTFVLICSSVTVVLALQASQKGDAKRTSLMLVLTILCGLFFLGAKAYDYHHLWTEGHTITSERFMSFFYLLTGIHGAHVLAGVVLLTCVLVENMRGRVSPMKAGWVESTGLYWHFVDVIWIILFAILCLI